MSSTTSRVSTQSSPSPLPDSRLSPGATSTELNSTESGSGAGGAAEMNGTSSPLNLHKELYLKTTDMDHSGALHGGGGGGGGPPPGLQAVSSSNGNNSKTGDTISRNGPTTISSTAADSGEDSKPQVLNMSSLSSSSSSSSSASSTTSSPLARPSTADKGHPERKRRASADSQDSYQTKASESAADDVSKEDEEENDEDDEDKMSGSDIDPERLKAFNMFVRLFVDENLDRMVPISKQPKDKIQAILDACDRQFPEFHERSRKRIRTYLKSCRRMRRSKETNGWDQLRPTPPHLTSAAAEGILAQACENESNNAKRMRMGLDPLPVGTTQPSTFPAPALPAAIQQPTSVTSTMSVSPAQTARTSPIIGQTTLSHSPSLPPAPPAPLDKQPPPIPVVTAPPPPPLPPPPPVVTVTDRRTPSAPTAFRPPHELPSPFFTNGNGIFRPGFPNSFQTPAHAHPPVIQHTPLASQIQQNGPTDLSMKKPSHNNTSSAVSSTPSKGQLNSTEVATIKQLIAGYRESAAFLYRSADELEQLLLHQN